MRERMHALTLMRALSAAFPSATSAISIAGANGPFASLPAVATSITGADGPLAPAADYALPYRAAGILIYPRSILVPASRSASIRRCSA